MPKINLIQKAVKKDKKQYDLKKEATKMGFSECPIDKIKVRYNPRKKFDKKSLNELAESIKSDGLIQPIVIDEDFNLIAGERRLKACQLLGFDSIKTVKYKGNSENFEVLSILENIHREDLTAHELGRACVELKEKHGWKQVDIAKHLNKSKGWISEVISNYKVLEGTNQVVSSTKARKISQEKKFGIPNFSKTDKDKQPKQLDLFNYKSFTKMLQKSEMDYKIRGNTISIKIDDTETMDKIKDLLNKK